MDELNRHNDFSTSHPMPGEDLPVDLRAIAQLYAAQPMPRSTPENTAHLLTRLLANTPAWSLVLDSWRTAAHFWRSACTCNEQK